MLSLWQSLLLRASWRVSELVVQQPFSSTGPNPQLMRARLLAMRASTGCSLSWLQLALCSTAATTAQWHISTSLTAPSINTGCRFVWLLCSGCKCSLLSGSFRWNEARMRNAAASGFVSASGCKPLVLRRLHFHLLPGKFTVNQHRCICHNNPYDRDPLTNQLHPVCKYRFRGQHIRLHDASPCKHQRRLQVSGCRGPRF